MGTPEVLKRCMEKYDQYDIFYEWERLGIQSHTLPNAIGMWEEEMLYMIELLQQCDFDNNWVEIGAFCGGSACLMNLVRTSQKYRGAGEIISVDLDFKPMFDINVGRLNFPHNIKKFQTNSSEFMDLYGTLKCTDNTHELISFVFIDGFHSYDQVIKDFEQVEPFLARGAIVAFHDASPFVFQPEWKEECHSGGWAYKEGEEDFRVDEAIFDILMDHKEFELMQRPPEYDCEHFQETGLTEWVRGTTSPFNSLVAIRKIV